MLALRQFYELKTLRTRNNHVVTSKRAYIVFGRNKKFEHM